jgi:ribonuclease Z
MLGTGTPNAEPDRCGSALAIVVDHVPYLIDCGANVVRRAIAAGIPVERLDRVFITHLHSDHTIGFPDVLLTPAVLGRPGALNVIGPPGVHRMGEHLMAAYERDIAERVEGLEHGNANAYRINAMEIKPDVVGECYRDERVRVIAFPVKHGTWKHAYGFRLEMPDNRVIAISGDTVPSDMLIEHARGCDILVHEVYSNVGFRHRPAMWREYHRHAHTSTIELAKIANETQPRLLVLTHALFWGVSEEDLVNEIRDRYDGEVILAHDLDAFDL